MKSCERLNVAGTKTSERATSVFSLQKDGFFRDCHGECRRRDGLHIYRENGGEKMKHLGTQRIETERLILRKTQLEDAQAMFDNWASDPEGRSF
jgi:hypothetical protein